MKSETHQQIYILTLQRMSLKVHKQQQKYAAHKKKCDNVSQNDPSDLTPAPIASVASEDDASLTSHFLASTKPLKAPDEMSSRLHL